MRILLTGVTGFIGRNLAKRLVSNGAEVYGIVRNDKSVPDGVIRYHDNGSDTDMISFFKKNRPDGVIHLATHYVADHKTEDVPRLVESNILFPTRILEAASLSGVRWFINTGTFAQNFDNKERNPLSLYASTKQSFEELAVYYSKYTGIDFVTLKLHSAYGPGDSRGKIFNEWLRISDTEEIFPMSPGDQLVDMVYIDDVVSAFTRMVDLLESDSDRKFNNKCYGILSRDSITLRGIASVFERVSGKRLNIEWGGKPYRAREVMQPIGYFESVPGWHTKVSMEEGMSRVLSCLGGASEKNV